MSDASRHDAWTAGDSYDAYMGRWSRRIAPRFVDWLGVPEGLHWLEVGCGTGALSEAILGRGRPASLIAIDPSEGFIDRSRATIRDDRVEFRVAAAEALGLADASRDVVVSGLVLNFLPDQAGALAEMKRIARPGGRVGFYVWDYPGGGMGIMQAFWDAADLDPAAAALSERRRFAGCTPDGLREIAAKAGLSSIQCRSLEVETVLADFDDFWRPFTLGAGPAPGYCASLEPEARDRLRDRLQASLPRREDGSIALQARAWAVSTIAA